MTSYQPAMPELPEVETVARGLALTLEGRKIVHVRQNRADLRVPFPPDLARRLDGRRVERIGRRAKYILIDLDDGSVLILHLGMSGRFIIRHDPAARPEPHDHLVLTADDGTSFVFNDPRRFGLVELVQRDAIEQHRLFAELGPEPLGNDFNGPALAAALAGRRSSIKAALLDQHVVAGLGNIYVSEALFLAGLSPKRIAATIQGQRAERLVAAIRQVLQAAIAAGGSTLRDYRRHDGELGYFQHSFAVYDREGQPCPGCDCDVKRTGGIRRIVQSNRSTFYCPRRQR
jgi:formamidopyrimidine-DNA glycosylase